MKGPSLFVCRTCRTFLPQVALKCGCQGSVLVPPQGPFVGPKILRLHLKWPQQVGQLPATQHIFRPPQRESAIPFSLSNKVAVGQLTFGWFSSIGQTSRISRSSFTANGSSASSLTLP